VLDTRPNQPFPPYAPVLLRAVGDAAPKESWITIDMPWAEAWYGDHASLWLPDTISDFNVIYDSYNQSSLLIITPIMAAEPASTLLTGEYKDWLPFVTIGAPPENFPLSRVYDPKIKDSIGYTIWQH
jgi:hypothetical protein